MTETTPERSALLLSDARRFAGIKSATWPGGEVSPEQLAALLAGGFKDKKPDYLKWRGRILDAIKAGTLKTREEKRPSIEVCRDADNLSDYERFNKAVFPKGQDFLGRVRMVYYEKREQAPIHHISPAQCAAWLRAIEEPQPNDYVRAWLGPEWKEAAPEKVSPGRTAKSEWRTRTALIEEVEEIWPTVRRDLQDASRSGLAAAAKNPKGRTWHKARALEWAREHGKLTKKNAAVVALPVPRWPDLSRRKPKSPKPRG